MGECSSLLRNVSLETSGYGVLMIVKIISSNTHILSTHTVVNENKSSIDIIWNKVV